MKKLLALTLSLLMVLAVVPMAMSSAETQTFEKTLITFDDSSERTSVSHTYDYGHYIEPVEGVGNGNVVHMDAPQGKGNSIMVRLTPGWRAYQPTAIKFYIKTVSNATLKVGFGSTASFAAAYSQGITVDTLGEGGWVTVSLEGLDISEFDYIAVGRPSVNVHIYLDDITLICSSEAIVNGAYEWTTLEDFENGVPESVAKSATAVTLATSAEAATNTVSTSTASITASTTGWNDQKSNNYVTISLDAEKMSIADDVRVFAKAEASGVDHFGIVLDGVTYWRSKVLNASWNVFYLLDETFTSAADNTAKVIRPSDLPNITALKFSFTQHKNYGTTMYIDDIEYAEFATGEVAPEDPNKVEVSMQSGAAIRLNNKNGIRFYTTVDAAKIAELKAAGKEVTMGTIIAPEDLIEGEFTHEDEHAEVKFTSSKYFEENTIVGSIVDIKETNIGRNFVGRGYVCVDGTYYYAEMNDNSRSLKCVSISLKADTATYEALDAEKKALVDSWAAAADWSAQ